MLVINQQPVFTVLCSTYDFKSFHCPPTVHSIHIREWLQAMHLDFCFQRYHTKETEMVLSIMVDTIRSSRNLTTPAAGVAKVAVEHSCCTTAEMANRSKKSHMMLPWAHGPTGPWAQSMGPCAQVPMGQWTHGPHDPLAHGTFGTKKDL